MGALHEEKDKLVLPLLAVNFYGRGQLLWSEDDREKIIWCIEAATSVLLLVVACACRVCCGAQTGARGFKQRHGARPLAV